MGFGAIQSFCKRYEKERQELIDWLGYEFDPEAFDINEANR